MSALDNMKTRINYAGGSNQEARMNNDKLRSLKKALLYSYQAQTAILTDDREFRCLINHDKLKEDYDDKIISIPYDDICLNAAQFTGKTSESLQHIGMKVGDVFTWKETNTKWIVIQEILEENAYFRGTIRKAEDEVVINGNSYAAYLRRPEYEELWHTKGQMSWSEMGYEVVLYITADDTTREYFHRFQKVNIKDRIWEVRMVDDITSDTMLIVYMKETYTNEFEPVTNDLAETASEETPTEDVPEITGIAAIIGADSAYPYDELEFAIENATGGSWLLSNNKAKINSQTTTTATITIVTGKAGTVDLIYRRDGEEDIVKTITIKSF